MVEEVWFEVVGEWGWVVGKQENETRFYIRIIGESTTAPEGTFPFRYFFRKEIETRIRTEIKTKNISFNRLIISFKRDNKTLKRYKIEWKLKQEKQNGN